MKKMFLFLFVILALSRPGRGQEYHPSTAVQMNEYLQQVVDLSEKDNWSVIRAECGIFSIRSQVIDYGTRILYPGHVYTIKVFTDKMIPDFKLVVWRANDANQYERLDSSDFNELRLKNITTDFLGDMEIVTVTPSVAREYAYQIVSMTGRNKTGHYGLVIQEKEVTQGSTGQNSSGGATDRSSAYRPVTRHSGYQSAARNGGSQGSNRAADQGTDQGANQGTNQGSGSTANNQHYVRTGSYEWAYLKENTFTHREVVDGNWQQASVKGLFAINEVQRTIEQLEPANLKASYRINNVSTQGKVITYQTTHVASGTSANITVDLNTSMLMIRSLSNRRPYLIKYYISQIN